MDWRVDWLLTDDMLALLCCTGFNWGVGVTVDKKSM